jgi:hypothetical protein
MKNMKLTKIALVALSATLAFGAKTAAGESIGSTTDHQSLTFSLLLSTQQPDQYNSTTHTWTYNYKTVKLTNKDILAMLAFMAQTTWPTGAQLEYDDESDQIIVADKTGNNVLFYAGDGVDNDSLYAYFRLNPYAHEGVYAGSDQNTTPGSQAYTEFYAGSFDLYIDDWFDDYANYMNLYGGGACTTAYSETWNNKKDSGVHGFSYNPVATGPGIEDGVTSPSSNLSYLYNLHYLTGTVAGFESWSSSNNPTVRKHSKSHKP